VVAALAVAALVRSDSFAPRRLAPAALALPALLAALVLAGCGSSSSRSSGYADKGVTQAVKSSGANDSTPITSSTYHDLLVKVAEQKGLSPAVANKVVDCVVRKETAEGYRTAGDVGATASSNAQATQDSAQCTKQALSGG
jgi:hypothetical protein